MGFWSNFAHIAAQIAPVVLAVIPGVPPVLGPLVRQSIIAAEHIPGASGEDKKAAVLQLVHDGLDAVNIAHGTTLAPSDALTASLSAGIDAVVSSVNAIKAAHDAIPPTV